MKLKLNSPRIKKKNKTKLETKLEEMKKINVVIT